MTTFNSATTPQLKTVVYCRANGMEPLAEMFESALEDVKAALITATDTVYIHRLQGKAQALNDFIELLETAPQIVARMK